MKYCDADWCEVRGVWRIPAADAATITFLDGRAPDFITVETLDRRSGRLTSRNATDGRVWLHDGTCRQLPFSGFPDTSNAIFEDPWQ